MLPLWAFGFCAMQERYTSGEHLVKTVEEFEKRNLPVDVIVQDWQYWGKNGWGIPSLMKHIIRNLKIYQTTARPACQVLHFCLGKPG